METIATAAQKISRKKFDQFLAAQILIPIKNEPVRFRIG
jgi:hypothetical protein